MDIKSKIMSVCVLFFATYCVESYSPIGMMQAPINNGKNVELETIAENCLNTCQEQIKSLEEKEVRYIDYCYIENIPKPEVRTEEEILAKIAELSTVYEAMQPINEHVGDYSIEMLESLANNPEMTDFVLHYLESDGNVTGGFTEEELTEEYPILLQWDTRWGYKIYGENPMGISGCGPTCLSMAIFYLTRNETVTPDVIADYSMEKGYHIKGVGTAWALLDEVPKEYELNVSHTSISEAQMKAELDKGAVLICSVRQGEFTSGGHFIVICGYDENGFMVRDPKCISRSRKSWTYEQMNGQIKKIWSITRES